MARRAAVVTKASGILIPHYRADVEQVDGMRSAKLTVSLDGAKWSPEDGMDNAWLDMLRSHREIFAVLATLEARSQNTLRLAFAPEPRRFASDYVTIRNGGFDWPSVALSLPVTRDCAVAVKQNTRGFLRGLVLGRHDAIKSIIARKMRELVEVASSDFMDAWNEREKKK